MSLYQSVYFMCLAGVLAGLSAWGFTHLASAGAAFIELPPELQESWAPDAVAMTMMGCFIGIFAGAFVDRWSSVYRPTAGRVILAAAAGMLGGVLATLIQIPITDRLLVELPLLTRLVAWMLAGSVIGLFVGLPWVRVNILRSAHSFSGGLLGGAVGGAVFAAFTVQIPDLAQALGFILLSIGISVGITLAPPLIREGVLEFVSSGDARAQNKFGRAGKVWELREGEYNTLGSQPQRSPRGHEEHVYIPDSAIAAQHAIVFGKGGRFLIARHPDAGGKPGIARYVLRVRGRTVAASSELRDTDDILIGKTALRFRAHGSGARAR